jgi:hypothetical protein
MFLELNNRPLKRERERKKKLSLFFFRKKKRKVLLNFFYLKEGLRLSCEDRYKNGASRYGTILLLNWLN